MIAKKAINLPSIAIIGAGKVGITIAILAKKSGYQIAAVAGRDLNKTAEAARPLGDVKICQAKEAARSAEIVFLSVSDDAIEPLCQELSETAAFRQDQIVVHFSGALSSESLVTARDGAGALIASIHPLQTFSTVQSALAAMPATFWFCEGDERALAVLLPLIESIGGKPELIPTEKKILYHAASVIACNYLVALMDLSLEVAELAGLERKLAWQALSPIVQTTLRNIDSSGTTSALTGPIARGDSSTVSRHLDALSRERPELAEIYKIMGLQTAQIAERKGLSQELLAKTIDALRCDEPGAGA